MMRLYKLPVLIGVILFLAIPYSIQAKESETVIVGGQPADLGEYPFMVALMAPDESDGFRAHYCGGVLIDPEWVLTAANCIAERESIDIGLGFHDLLDSPNAERIASSNIYVHPDYNIVTDENDIALIQLSSPVTGYSLAQYATSEAQNSAGISAIAIGWGQLSETSVVGGGQYPTILHEVDLPIVANEDCNVWGFDGEVTADMLCAGYREGEKDACTGDAGGPLFYYEGGLPIVVGVISWGRGCARPDLPGVYARVSYFTDWIDSHLNVQSDGSDTPLAITFNRIEIGTSMIGWMSLAVILIAQASVVAFVLRGRIDSV